MHTNKDREEDRGKQKKWDEQEDTTHIEINEDRDTDNNRDGNEHGDRHEDIGGGQAEATIAHKKNTWRSNNRCASDVWNVHTDVHRSQSVSKHRSSECRHRANKKKICHSCTAATIVNGYSEQAVIVNQMATVITKIQKQIAMTRVTMMATVIIETAIQIAIEW